MRTLILNSTNIVPGSNNSILQYKFPAGNVKFLKGDKLALASLQMYYSTFNITALNQNNVFNYIWVDGTSHQVLFPDGFYDATSINNYLHQVFINNGHYLIANNGNFVYFITIGTNASTYSIEINCFPMSATLYPIGTGNYTYPTGATWVVPTANIVPMVQVLSNNFQYIIGFSAGYYPQGQPLLTQAAITGTAPSQTQSPTYTTIQAFTSNIVPQITPLSSYTLTCSLLNNNYSIPNTLLYSFAPVGTFGNQFTIQPSGQLSFIDIQPGQYAQFLVQLTDQNNNPVAIQDPNFVILLVILGADEGSVAGSSKLT
jgi:hypothetical protein